MDAHHRRFIVWVTGCCACMVLGALVLNFLADPFWLVDRRAERNDSSALDTQMRQAKALQLMARDLEQPLKVVFIGSSTVYRGLNPAVLDYPPGAVYNLGISSLRMAEARAFARHLLQVAAPEVVVIGLDFFQFDGLRQVESGFDPGLGTWNNSLESLLSAGISGNAVSNSLSVLRARARGNAPGKGWMRDGYRKTTPERSDTAIKAHMAGAMSVYGHADMRIERPYEELHAMLAELQDHHVVALLYLSPLHPRYEDAIRVADKWPQYLAWRTRVKAVAAALGLDLFEPDLRQRFPGYGFDADSGFNDPAHFSEAVGTLILRGLGLPIRATANGVIGRPGP